MSTPIIDQLRAWAHGNYSTEAGTELLVRAFAGRFARPGYPWIHHEPRPWIHFDAITDSTTGVYSGGERRLLAIAASLGGDRLVSLSEVLPGLDAATLRLVVGAAAHAGDGLTFPEPAT